jgi:hypothetical protein
MAEAHALPDGFGRPFTAPSVRFVTGEAFVAHPVPDAEPIVVDSTGATVVAAEGFGLTFGDGGAGKTTLWLDAAMHLAAGIAWLDRLLVPTRPLRIGWIENEGPQEEFRRKLERKLASCQGRFPADHLHVLDIPWAAVDLRDEQHRAGLADAVRRLDLDLLIAGPLNDLGMEGGGTPDEVRLFYGHLKDVQAERRASCVADGAAPREHRRSCLGSMDGTARAARPRHRPGPRADESLLAEGEVVVIAIARRPSSFGRTMRGSPSPTRDRSGPSGPIPRSSPTFARTGARLGRLSRRR